MFSRRRSSWKRKSQRRPWLPIVLLLIGVPIGLELLTRLVVQLAGVNDQLTASPSGKTEIVDGYRLGFLSPAGQPYTALPEPGQLLAARNPLMSYNLKPKQESKFWTINQQGFRDGDPVPVDKANGEVRIFVLGGSTAFGQLNSNNQATFAEQLEKLLNDRVAAQQSKATRFQPAILPYRADQVAEALALPPRIPEQKYRVVNAAVPGYTSGNELAMLMQQVASYNPDMLVVLDSYPDLLLPSSQPAAEIPGLDALIQGERENPVDQLSKSVGDWFRGLYLTRVVDRYILQSQPPTEELAIALNVMVPQIKQPLDQLLTSDPKELNQRVMHYRDHLRQMVQWGAANRKRVFVGLQPEITSRSATVITAEESAILAKLGSSYSERVKDGYTEINKAAEAVTKSNANTKLLNLYDLYATYKGQAFQSPTSLTDDANKVLANKFFEAIVQQVAIDPKPFGGE